MYFGIYVFIYAECFYFAAQLVATFISAFVQIGVKHLIFATVPDICSPLQQAHLICPHNKAFFTASAVWLVIQMINTSIRA